MKIIFIVLMLCQLSCRSGSESSGLLADPKLPSTKKQCEFFGFTYAPNGAVCRYEVATRDAGGNITVCACVGNKIVFNQWVGTMGVTNNPGLDNAKATHCVNNVLLPVCSNQVACNENPKEKCIKPWEGK